MATTREPQRRGKSSSSYWMPKRPNLQPNCFSQIIELTKHCQTQDWHTVGYSDPFLTSFLKENDYINLEIFNSIFLQPISVFPTLTPLAKTISLRNLFNIYFLFNLLFRITPLFSLSLKISSID